MEQTNVENSSRWPQGVSGNPAGRPRGSRNKRTVLIEHLLDDEIEDVIRKLVELAKAGNIAAIKLLLDRFLPRRRPVELELPELRGLDDACAAGKTILAAAVAGEISGEEADALMRALESNARITALEERSVAYS